MKVIKVELGRVRVADRLRAYRKEHAAELARSMGDIGLIQPIVCAGEEGEGPLDLVAGRHRLGAAALLGWTHIDAAIVAPGDQAESDRDTLREIDENLFRAALTELERGEHVALRADVWERLHGPSQTGAAGAAARWGATEGEAPPAAFVPATAATMDESERSVRRSLLIGQMPADVRDLIRGTPVETRRMDLAALASMEDVDTMRKVARYIADGKASTLAEALAAVGNLDAWAERDAWCEDCGSNRMFCWNGGTVLMGERTVKLWWCSACKSRFPGDTPPATRTPTADGGGARVITEPGTGQRTIVDMPTAVENFTAGAALAGDLDATPPAEYTRDELDRFYTYEAEWIVEALVSRLPRGELKGKRILEPCAGHGHIVRELEKHAPAQIVTGDIDHDVKVDHYWDFTEPGTGEELGVFDWVVTNSPYGKHVEGVARQSLRVAPAVALLTRINFLEPWSARTDLLVHGPPSGVIFLPRPSFTEDGQRDRAGVAWVVWHPTINIGVQWVSPDVREAWLAKREGAEQIDLEAPREVVEGDLVWTRRVLMNADGLILPPDSPVCVKENTRGTLVVVDETEREWVLRDTPALEWIQRPNTWRGALTDTDPNAPPEPLW